MLVNAVERKFRPGERSRVMHRLSCRAVSVGVECKGSSPSSPRSPFMQRFLAVSLSSLLVAGILVGCNKRQAKNDDPPPAVDPNVQVDPPKQDDPKKGPKKQADPPKTVAGPIDPAKERKFNDALNRGL